MSSETQTPASADPVAPVASEPVVSAAPAAAPGESASPVSETVELVEVKHPVDERVLLAKAGNLAQLATKLRLLVGDGELNLFNVCDVVKDMMIYAESFKVPGPERKEMILSVVESFLTDHHCDKSLMGLIPAFIEVAIQLDQKKISIKKPAGVCLAFLGAWCGDKTKA